MVMHLGQLHVDATTVRRLIDDQFPQWRHEPVNEVDTDGTVNAIFRIGGDLAARFPLTGDDPATVRAILEAEANATRELASCSPIATPTPVAIGAPGHGYPLPWAVQTWLPGRVATPDGSADSFTFAADLTDLIRALRGADIRGRRFSGNGRGGSLRDHDWWMDTCFRESEKLLDVPRLRLLWAEFRDLPEGGPEVMSHGDLIPPNLLVHDGRLVGVLDGGGFGPADPALDLVAVWHLLDAERREAVRRSIGSGHNEWSRGEAWAFVQSMGVVRYFIDSNPGMSALGRSTLTRILDESRP